MISENSNKFKLGDKVKLINSYHSEAEFNPIWGGIYGYMTGEIIAVIKPINETTEYQVKWEDGERCNYRGDSLDLVSKQVEDNLTKGCYSQIHDILNKYDINTASNSFIGMDYPYMSHYYNTKQDNLCDWAFAHDFSWGIDNIKQTNGQRPATNMSLIKNALKSKESKAITNFNLGENSKSLNHDGLMEFLTYIYETNKELKGSFLDKLVELDKENKENK